ncbi:MAG: cation transporter [Beijerinckiaceae bacterium]
MSGAPVGPAFEGSVRAYKRTIWAIAAGILLFAAGQAAWALSLGSRQLLKDALDWGYDVVIYALAAIVFGRGVRAEQTAALIIAAILAAAGLHTLYDLWDKIVEPRPIEPFTIGFSAVSASVIGYIILFALLRFRRDENPLVRATWVSTRNAVIMTTVFAAATYLTRMATERWPEYALDVLGAGLLFQAAGAIALATMRDRRAAKTGGA